MLICGYLSSLDTRIFDEYGLWPSTEISGSQWQPARPVRSTVGFYAFVLLVLALFFSTLFLLLR